MRKQILYLASALLLFGCSGNKIEKEGTGTYTNENDEVITAHVKLKDDNIVEVSIDETAKGKDKTKKELGEDYGMKQASTIHKEWSEQIAYLEKYIAKNGIDGIKVKEDGTAENADVRTGCTIRVDNYLKAIEQAKKDAK